MAYIANRPVRFDRDYKIGEVIPDAVIAPGMARRLAEMGRIVRVDIPQDSAGSAADGVGSTGNVNTQDGAENPQDGADSGPVEMENTAPEEDTDAPFICEECGRVFKSQNALAAHTRAHKD